MAAVGESEIIFDAEGLILGRLASVVAKKLLDGEKVHIVNAEKAIVSGKRQSLVRAWKDFLEIKSMANPKYGPFHSRRPDTVLRDVVRGMLPTDKAKGRSSLKRLRVYIGIPDSLKEAPMETIPKASSSKLRGRHVKLGELAAEIGWKRQGID